MEDEMSASGEWAIAAIKANLARHYREPSTHESLRKKHREKMEARRKRRMEVMCETPGDQDTP